MAPVVEDLAAALAEADLEEAPEVALAVDLAEVDSADTEAVIIIVLVMVTIAVRCSLVLVPVITAAVDALADFLVH